MKYFTSIEPSVLSNILAISDFRDAEYDLGICGTDLIALAGTGPYKKNVGNIRPHCYLQEAVKCTAPIILENKDRSPRCLKCNNKSICPYKSVIFYPLVFDQDRFGALYLMSRTLIHNNLDYFVNHLSKVRSTIGHMALFAKKSNINSKYIEHFIESIPNGIIITDKSGIITNVNKKAENILQVKKPRLMRNKINKYIPNFNHHRLKYKTLCGDTYYVNSLFSSPDLGFILNLTEVVEIDNLPQMDFIIGESEEIKKAKHEAMVIANHDSSTLLVGESGTGKELFAQAIHSFSHRGNRDMVLIDCSAIPENLMESELFGYVEGAFTGAKQGGRKGKFELAQLSTVFLDEIGEIPLHLQAKLLRVIENHSFNKIGDVKSKSVNIRIIAATKRDLDDMVDKGTFREDLYYRLNVMRLDIPPLRKRRGDIKVLLDFFLNHFSNKLNKSLRIEGDLIPLLEKHKWPGNVRELKNLIEYCSAFTDSGLITYTTLPRWFRDGLNDQSYETSHVADGDVVHLLSVEKTLIEKALLMYGGNTTMGKRKAANALGMSLATLYRRIKKYKIFLKET